MSSSHLILCRPLLFLPIPPSIKVFSNESALHIRWPKYWTFSFNISPSNEDSRLISFRMDWLDLLVVQGTLKSRLQHHSSKASVVSVQFSSVAQSCPTLCDPMNRSTPGLPVHHQLPEFKRYRVICCTVNFRGYDVLHKCYCVIRHTMDLKDNIK